jgi:carboxymethylenebutenolidase
MALRDYLAEEVARECAATRITRREALRQLGLMGLSVTAAGALLAACASDDSNSTASSRPRPVDRTPVTTRPSNTTAPPTTAPAATGVAEAVTFAGPQGTLQGAWAAAASPKGSVLVIHENRGLTDHIRSIPARFARDGYSALAIDLLSEEGGTASVGADATAALARAPESRMIADLRAGLDELTRRVPGKKLAVIGFCFGGGMTWKLLAAGEPRLAAAAPFYGPTPASPNFSASKAAVLAVYGELDSFVNPGRDAAIAALQSAGLTYDVKTYPGAGHAFFNDTGASYNATAATQAYAAVLDWFGRYVG